MNVELDFQLALEDQLEQTIKHGYHPTTFITMKERYGGVRACKRLIRTSDEKSGFERLKDMNRLDLTIEALIIDNLELFGQLFEPDEIEVCEFKLKHNGYFE